MRQGELNLNASRFIGKLDGLGFIKYNTQQLDNYMGRGRTTALQHIKSSYVKLYDEGWNERKLADITYIIARDNFKDPRNKLYTSSYYKEAAQGYEDMRDEVIEERARYEQRFKVLVDEKKKADEDELLEYIRKNGGLTDE